MMKYRNYISHIIVCLALAIIASACSTTSRLGENDILYTGVKKVNYHRQGANIDGDVQDQIFEVINVKPNNPLYSPYYRTPFPVGLWVYNHWDADATGLKGWLYNNLVSHPVTIRRVNPDTRVDMINTLLANNGYFRSKASYTLNTGKNPKKASVTYDINVTEPYTLGEITYRGDGSTVSNIIDSLALNHHYLRTGNRYCVDSLTAVRVDITNNLRNRGYYFYRPEYIQYLADSVNTPGVVNLQVIQAPDVPNQASIQYVTGDIKATVYSYDGGGVPDTIDDERCTLVMYEPVRLKPSAVTSNIRARKGRPFRINSLDRTQVALSRLGIFSNIDMQVTTLDSLDAKGRGILDLDINLTVDRPWEVKMEVQGTSKSNSFIGPALELGLTHKNVFGAGEKLSIAATAAYEWQTGRGNSAYRHSDLNSYEFGIKGDLAIPRLLAPRFVDRSRRYVNWTRFSLNASILNRPDYFKMLQLGGGMTWEWHANKLSLNEFTPFSLTYNKLMNKSTAFDSIMTMNPALNMSFVDVFIPKMQYTYTYDNTFGRDHITWKTTVMEAGNILSGIWSLAGKHGEKKMLGTPFSQFVKAESQVVWTRALTPESQFAARVDIGAVHAYGNMKEVPFREQFYAGGANSVRAFTVRSIGPGSYAPAVRSVYDYYDQTGTFKFEANMEYRFPILGYFKGAVFLDAGNIWLLKDEVDEFGEVYRPEGKLRLKNFFKELAVGTGVGLRFDMEMLVVRADLGIAIHAPYDTGKSGYYNIRKFGDSLALHLAIGYPF